jgi:putative chitinase
MTAFTREQVRKFAPLAKAELVEVLVNGIDLLEAAQINTPLRLQHFMAQVATETGGLRQIEENLSYSAERLRQVWPSRFPNLTSAKLYARNPKKLAAKVYGGRMGNKTPEDAWNFRGSGLLQTTGRENFTKAGYADNPDYLRTPDGALHAALEFWTRNGCNAFADRDDVTGLRRRINGGTNGLAEARTYLRKAKQVFVTFEDVEPESVAAMPPARIRELQNHLLRVGYIELGRADGQIGTRTIAAISSFQAENGLTVNGQFDDDTVEALYSAEPREVVRASDEPTDPTILRIGKKLQTGAVGLLGASGISLAGDPLSNLEAARDLYSRAKFVLEPFSWLSTFAHDHWMLLVGAAGAGIFYYGHRISKVTVEQHLTGRTA